jgi:hypothetical protein
VTGWFPGRNDARIGWMLAVVLAIGGYEAVVAPAAARVRSIVAHAHDMYEIANRTDRLLRDANGVTAARSRVERDVARLAARGESAMTMLATIRLLQEEARRHRVVIAGLSPGERDAATNRKGSADVTIAMRGTYRNVLEAVADLSKGDVLIDIRDVALAQDSNDADPRDVDAIVRATLYYRIAAIVKEKDDDRKTAR